MNFISCIRFAFHKNYFTENIGCIYNWNKDLVTEECKLTKRAPCEITFGKWNALYQLTSGGKHGTSLRPLGTPVRKENMV